MGRSINEEDGRSGAPPVFVMSYRLWQREFGGDRNILGKTFVIRDISRLWWDHARQALMPSTRAFGCLCWRVRLEAILLDVSNQGLVFRRRVQNSTRLRTTFSRKSRAARFQRSSQLKSMLESQIGNFKTTLYALLAAVFLLLLIACSNVANLLLVRGPTVSANLPCESHSAQRVAV